jgi:FkbH-like protein
LPKEKGLFADTYGNKINELISNILDGTSSRIIISNIIEYQDGVFGNFAHKTTASLLFQSKKFNYDLMNIVSRQGNVFVLDINMLALQNGIKYLVDEKIYISTGIDISIQAVPQLAFQFVQIIKAISGRINKCLILDLDNTLWGGVIGDDGIEEIEIGRLGIGKAFTRFQLWIKALKERGIILAICSKNNEEIAKDPFLKHPEMILSLNDIAVFVANWENKANNIKHIQSVLNIGFDSMVFIDDNPFERSMVRENISGITVPELPEDPSEYVSFLASLNLFETSSYSENDLKRTGQYKEEEERVKIKKHFVNENDFLQSLKMTSNIELFTKFNIPRVGQLIQRSNQFNLRTIRYTENEISVFADSKNYIDLTFTLKDKFGDYGLIAVVIIHKKEELGFIDTWIMSCRILKRGVEKFILNKLIEIAKLHNLKKLIGEHVPTPKNDLVKDHYQNLGFVKVRNIWECEIATYEKIDCLITEGNNST